MAAEHSHGQLMSAPCSKVLIGFLTPLRLMQMPACEYTCALLNLTSGCIGAAQPLAKARCVVLHTECYSLLRCLRWKGSTASRWARGLTTAVHGVGSTCPQLWVQSALLMIFTSSYPSKWSMLVATRPLLRCLIPEMLPESCMTTLTLKLPMLAMRIHHPSKAMRRLSSSTQGEHTRLVLHYCSSGPFLARAQHHNTCCVCRQT